MAGRARTWPGCIGSVGKADNGIVAVTSFYGARTDEAHTFHEAAHALRRSSWTRVVRRFTDGHGETWWAAEVTFGGYPPRGPVRAVVARPHSFFG